MKEKIKKTLNDDILYQGSVNTSLSFYSLDNLIKYYIDDYIEVEVCFRIVANMFKSNLTVLQICVEIGGKSDMKQWFYYNALESNGEALRKDRYIHSEYIDDYINHKANIIRRNFNIDKLLNI